MTHSSNSDVKMKILIVIGARPQFIKMAPVIHALQVSNHFNIKIVHTGQHYSHSLSEIFFQELNLPKPDYNLEVGSSSQALQISQILASLSPILNSEMPALTLVVGDTNSTSAAAMCSAMHQIPVAHIEAGLREFDLNIPEEINKLLTDSVTSLYLPPTQTGANNLFKTGVYDNVHVTGDVGLDLVKSLTINPKEENDLLEKYKLIQEPYTFLTCHRAANTDNKQNLENILKAISKIENKIVFPIHPRTKQAIENHNLTDLLNATNAIVIDPIGFQETQILIKNAKMVLTDSGGVIKEAYYHKTPCIILDKQTEWIELLEEGWAQIAGPYEATILTKMNNFTVPTAHNQVLGDGHASEKISKIIYEFLQHKK